jgi:ribonuclease III
MVTPTYELLSETGADHDKEYKIGVYYATKLIGSGSGSSKKKAQTAAAEDALTRRGEWDVAR